MLLGKKIVSKVQFRKNLKEELLLFIGADMAKIKVTRHNVTVCRR
jgi:hypothetical protein